MTESNRDRQLLREAEGYLDLAVATGRELPVVMRRQLGERCLDRLAHMSGAMANRAPAKMLRGQALKLAERFNEAVEVLEDALQADDENVHLYLALAWCYKRTGWLDRAIETLEAALIVDDDEPVLFYNLGCYWAVAGNIEQTLLHLSRAFDLRSNLRDLTANEPDFDRVRQHPDFQALLTATV